MGMAMTEPRLILSTISQINHPEQERIQSSYRESQQASGPTSKKPRKPFTLGGFCVEAVPSPRWIFL